MGAWIETAYWLARILSKLVATRVGAWIETLHEFKVSFVEACRAPRGRVD